MPNMASMFRGIRDYRQLPSTDSFRGDDDDDEKAPIIEDESIVPPVKYRRDWNIRYGLTLLLFSTMLSTTTFFLGRYSTATMSSQPAGLINGQRPGPLISPAKTKLTRAPRLVGTVLTRLNYNYTFAATPSHETDQAWGALFPPHNGFFHDAEIAPLGASLSVYHQLHCLDGMRHAFYIMYEAAKSGERVDFENLAEPFQLMHTTHCIDFLRQKIMCNADVTIEYVGPEHNGTIVFGNEYQCTRWPELTSWVVDRQARWEKEKAERE